jgi:hypothetical protein
VGIPQRLVDILLGLGYIVGAVSTLKLRKCYEKAGSRLHSTFDTRRLKIFDGVSAHVYLSRCRTDCAQPVGANAGTPWLATNLTSESPYESGRHCYGTCRMLPAAGGACDEGAHTESAAAPAVNLDTPHSPPKVLLIHCASDMLLCADCLAQDSIHEGDKYDCHTESDLSSQAGVDLTCLIDDNMRETSMKVCVCVCARVACVI